MDVHQRLRLAQALLQFDHQQNALVMQQVMAHRRQAMRRRWWTGPWLLRRPAFGQFEQLMSELELENPASFQTFLRFEPDMFQKMVDRLTPRIAGNDTNFRKSLEPGLN